MDLQTRPHRISALLALCALLAAACGGSAQVVTPEETEQAPPLTLALVQQSPGIVGAPFTTSFEVEGGTSEAFDWDVASGSIPPGVTLVDAGAREAQLQGIPTSVGFFTATVRASSQDDGAALRKVTLAVVAAPPVDPSNSIWFPVGSQGAPRGRVFHSAVWTGSKMIVWGGLGLSAPPNGAFESLNCGGAYLPNIDAWESISDLKAPSKRFDHTAIWTGSEMIVWGGRDPDGFATEGAAYRPLTDTWRTLPKLNAPQPRIGHTATWTGTEMIVLGGSGGPPRELPQAPRESDATTQHATGSANFAPNSGAPLPPRDDTFEDGAAYNPTTDSWRTLTPPTGTSTGSSAIWTGTELLTWSGLGGSIYVPNSDLWLPLSTAAAPGALYGHTAVWTGAPKSEMLIWGGEDANFNALRSGGRYSPTGDRWDPIPTDGAPGTQSGQTKHTAVWAHGEMIVFGGLNHGIECCGTSIGGAYNPDTNTWRSLPLTERPSPRAGHTAVWTGSRMIIWGGWSANDVGPLIPFNDGALLKP